jgi:pyruvate, water dikinase
MLRYLSQLKPGSACRPLPTLGLEETGRYRRFRRLLEHHRTALSLQAELERIYHDDRPFSPQAVEKICRQLLLEADGMVNAFSALAPGENHDYLFAVLRSLERGVEVEWSGLARRHPTSLVLPLAEIGPEQGWEVGGKAVNLARVAKEFGLRVPPGVVVTTAGNRLFFAENGLAEEIDDLLAELDDDHPLRLQTLSDQLTGRILATPLPPELGTALAAVAAEFPPDQKLAVRSSAVGEDSEFSFAGQYLSLLNVAPANLAEAYRRVIAGRFSPAALSYHLQHGLDHRETPMAVLVLAMVEPRCSGVLYTDDPSGENPGHIQVSLVAGLAEGLVGGLAAAEQQFFVAKESGKIRPLAAQPVTEAIALVEELVEIACQLEARFASPLDIEWAQGEDGHLFLLQVRPLLLPPQEPSSAVSFDPKHPVLFEGGRCAAAGVAVGRVYREDFSTRGEDIAPLAADTILVSRTATTLLTPWVSKVRGIITDVGGTTSHLAAVAREFRIPALFDTGVATSVLRQGEEITLWASRNRVYRGAVKELLHRRRRVQIFNSPAHLRLGRLLELFSPYSLGDPGSGEFAPENCRSLRDIVTCCHELAVRQMFRFGESIGQRQNAVQLRLPLPLQLIAYDLGGGLRPGLTTCDEINPYDIVSVPFSALWQGLSDPAIDWSKRATGTTTVDFNALLAAGLGAIGYRRQGGASHAIVAGDYLNLTLNFQRQQATIDSLAGETSEDNYISLSIGGGAGSFHDRGWRALFLASVLDTLGFNSRVRGDLLEASLLHLDQAASVAALEQLGRLLGVSQMLEQPPSRAEQLLALRDAFFAGAYDAFLPVEAEAPAGYFPLVGTWREAAEDGETGIVQDGLGFTSPLSAGIAQTMSRLLGRRYQDFLANVGANFSFPLAVAGKSLMADGSAQVLVKVLGGTVDQAAGLAVAVLDASNYWVFRINVLEQDAVLYQFRNGKWSERRSCPVALAVDSWYLLRVAIAGEEIRAFLDGRELFACQADQTLRGYLGLWTKADSVSLFRELRQERHQ